MDMEEEFKRFQDTGLMVGLGFGVASLGVLLCYSVERTWVSFVQIGTIGLLAFLAVATILFAAQKRVAPLHPKRSTRERIVSAAIGLILHGVLGASFYFFSKGEF